TSSHTSHHFLLNAPPTTYIYTLSLHDALPISRLPTQGCAFKPCPSRFRRRKTASARDPKRRSLPDDCFGEINIAALLNHSSATCNDANGFIDSTALEPIYVARYSL